MNGLNILPPKVIEWLSIQGRSIEITRPGLRELPGNPEEPHTCVIFHSAELEGKMLEAPAIIGGEPKEKRIRRLQSRYIINITDRYSAQVGADYIWRKIGQEVGNIQEKYVDLDKLEAMQEKPVKLDHPQTGIGIHQCECGGVLKQSEHQEYDAMICEKCGEHWNDLTDEERAAHRARYRMAKKTFELSLTATPSGPANPEALKAIPPEGA